MTAETFQRASTTPLVSEISDDGRSVTVRLVPWDCPTVVRDRSGRQQYVERFARGGLIVDPDDRILAEREHDGPVVGTLVSTEDRPDGLYGTIRVSRSIAGSDTLADLDPTVRILRSVSVDFLDDPVPPGAVEVVRRSAKLRRVAFVLDAALDAPVVSVRSVPTDETTTTTTTERDPSMSTEQTTVEADSTSQTEAAPTTVVDAAPQVVEQRSAPTRPAASVQRSRPAPQFPTFGHFARAAALGEIAGSELELYQRALADLVTGDAAGMIHEQWIPEVVDLARTYTPTVNAWRERPLPTSGMSISQPVVETRPTVDQQLTQKSEVESTAVEVVTAQWDIETFAGGNDVSIQLIRRADPDYLTELMRLYTRELAQRVNLSAATRLLSAADDVNATLEYVDPETFDELVIDASAAFMRSPLRRPAELMALSVDLWSALGKAKDNNGRPLYPSVNPMNANGTLSAVDTTGEIRRIAWYVEPDLGAGIAGVVGVREAFVCARGPVGTLTADVPAKLGRDVAMYQEAASGASDASGLVRIVDLL